MDTKIVATRPKCADVKNRPKMAAVEVDPAGCSYNPDHEQHQDAVAVAVAAENMKLIDRELQPKVCVCSNSPPRLCVLVTSPNILLSTHELFFVTSCFIGVGPLLLLVILTRGCTESTQHVSCGGGACCNMLPWHTFSNACHWCISEIRRLVFL